MLIARNMQSAVVVEDMLGEGGQAEVYRARIGDADYALKWYRPEYLAGDRKTVGPSEGGHQQRFAHRAVSLAFRSCLLPPQPCLWRVT